MAGHIATAEVEISAAPGQVWAALVDPKQIEKYMFGTQVETDWQPGSTIVWRGEYEGKKYEDKGQILEIEPKRLLKLTHFSPLTGQEDVPANYHTLVYELQKHGTTTHVSLSQDNNESPEEAQRATDTWNAMLSGLKEVVERG